MWKIGVRDTSENNGQVQVSVGEGGGRFNVICTSMINNCQHATLLNLRNRQAEDPKNQLRQDFDLCLSW